MPCISNTAKGLSIAYLGAAYTFLGKNTDAVAQYEKALEFAKENQVQYFVLFSTKLYFNETPLLCIFTGYSIGSAGSYRKISSI